MRAKLAVCVLGLSLLMISATPQDAIRLESRINQLEQRLYSMETTIRTLEQQSRMAGAGDRWRNSRHKRQRRFAPEVRQSSRPHHRNEHSPC